MTRASTRTFWQAEQLPTFPALRGTVTTDVVIIGAGITGLTAGLALLQAGKSVVILDQASLGEGETGHTSAHLTEMTDTRYFELIEDRGIGAAIQVCRSMSAAMDRVENWTAQLKIDCEFERVSGYLYRDTVEGEKNSQKRILEMEARALKKVGVDAKLVEAAPLPWSNGPALQVQGQAQFHPLRYLRDLTLEIARLGGHIYEQTRALEAKDDAVCEVRTSHGLVRAGAVFVATHVPVMSRFFHVKLAAYRSYVMTAELLDPFPAGLYWDLDEPYRYIRLTSDTQGKTIAVVGGYDHKTGQSKDTEECFSKLEHYARARMKLGPSLQRWSGQVIETLDGLPYIGRMSGSKRIYISTGYSGTGLTFGTLGGMMVADEILGIKNSFAELYSAGRVRPLSGAGEFINENKDTPYYYFKDRMERTPIQAQDLAPNTGAIAKYDGETAAVYCDADGVIHAFSPVCPHLHCHVHWNSGESSWDCPCHGSRFNALGKVINGPARKDLTPLQIQTEFKETGT